MAQTVAEHFERERQKVLNQCTKCGICIKECSFLKHTDLKDVNPREIQKKVVDFLHTGISNDTVYTKAFACMECYECVFGRCTNGLSPLTIHVDKYVLGRSEFEQYCRGRTTQRSICSLDQRGP